ncbi:MULTISPECIES: FAD-dependent monooxygenase [unclassified Streptomyces]|uniref:FAD-dependent monooxygenase n=1 Tax=unclassified Streptomyces TaxID=2593676 RepID=UPI0005633ADE|nr:FAD-dependent monooxygenase [Streptomyces sp. NRRL F-5630]
MPPSSPRRVLVSGAGIAGSALAYWLGRHGFDVTVVEKAASAFAPGRGHAVTLGEAGREVAERMGLLPALRAAHVGQRLTTRLDAAGEVRETVRPVGGELRVRRGDLLAALRGALEGRAEVLAGDSVATLDDDGEAVHVAFDSGDFRTYDLVIGAEGPHSNTRRLVFGPERPFHHYSGQVFAGFSLPNDFGLAHETVEWEAPGRRARLTAYGPGEPAHACLTLTREDPPYTVFGDPWAQRELVRGYFPEQVWHLPRLMRAMWRADDLHVDVVGEIRIRAWSHERFALVGDAAWGGSLLAGEGAGKALAGAYVLAEELAVGGAHEGAFARYEERLRAGAEKLSPPRG